LTSVFGVFCAKVGADKSAFKAVRKRYNLAFINLEFRMKSIKNLGCKSSYLDW
jgi:hypothetical protein